MTLCIIADTSFRKKTTSYYKIFTIFSKFSTLQNPKTPTTFFPRKKKLISPLFFLIFLAIILEPASPNTITSSFPILMIKFSKITVSNYYFSWISLSFFIFPVFFRFSKIKFSVSSICIAYRGLCEILFTFFIIFSIGYNIYISTSTEKKLADKPNTIDRKIVREIESIAFSSLSVLLSIIDIP